MDNLRFIVKTSNNYVKMIPGFCYLFNKYWDKNQKVHILHNDIAPNNIPDNFVCEKLSNQVACHWSSNLKSYLENIEEEYICMLLDDFYINAPVNLNHINKLVSLIQIKKEIKKIDLSFDTALFDFEHTFYDKIDDLFILLRSQGSDYRTSLQAALWDKKYFMSFLFHDRINPWEFETTGMQRARNDGAVILGTSNNPVRYGNIYNKGKISLYSKDYYPHLGVDSIPVHDVKYIKENNLFDFK